MLALKQAIEQERERLRLRASAAQVARRLGCHPNPVPGDDAARNDAVLSVALDALRLLANSRKRYHGVGCAAQDMYSSGRPCSCGMVEWNAPIDEILVRFTATVAGEKKITPACQHCEDKGGCSECNVCGLCHACKQYNAHADTCPYFGPFGPLRRVPTSGDAQSVTVTGNAEGSLCRHCGGPWWCKTCFTHGPVTVKRGQTQETGVVYGEPGGGIRQVQLDTPSPSGVRRCDLYYLDEIQQVPEKP